MLRTWLSFSTSFCHFLTKKMDFIIKVSVDNFCKSSNSYHFGGNRTRTLLTSPFTSKLLPLRAGKHAHSSTGARLYSWSNSMAHWSFPSPLSFLLALSISHAISIFWLYTGEITFWVKVHISWTKINRVFFTLHTTGKLRIFWWKPHFNWMTTSLDISLNKHALQKYCLEFW